MTKRNGIRDVDSRFPAVVTSRVCLSWREDSGNEVSKSGLVYRPRLVVPFLRQPSRGGLFLGAARATAYVSVPIRDFLPLFLILFSLPLPLTLLPRSTATLLGPLILSLSPSFSFFLHRRSRDDVHQVSLRLVYRVAPKSAEINPPRRDRY